MLRLSTIPLVAGLVFVSTLAFPVVARAGIEACGDIEVGADAHCELVARGCEVECTPYAVEAACAAELYFECEGGCDANAGVQCETSCYAGCEAECEIDPGAFECAASCRADCSAGCAARCDSEDSECWASCESTCSAECDVSCSATPPEADCHAQCEASCGGSCRAEANLDCQIDCQAESFAGCQVDLQGGCEADCRDAGAALFCDGQYVDYGNFFQECLDALESLLDGEVEGSATFECRPGHCDLSAAGLFACSVEDDHPRHAGLAALLLGLGLGTLRRRRHREGPYRRPT